MGYNFKECKCNRKRQTSLLHGLKKDPLGIIAAWFSSVAANLITSLNVHHLCTMFLALFKSEVFDQQGEKRVGTRGFEPLTFAPSLLILNAILSSKNANVHHLRTKAYGVCGFIHVHSPPPQTPSTKKYVCQDFRYQPFFGWFMRQTI